MRRIIHPVVMIFILISFNINAQQPCNISVTGQAICTDDNKSVFAAIVSVAASKEFAQTDIDGKFVLNNLCAGENKISVSIVGFQKLDTIINLTANSTIRLNLKPASVHLNEVSVEGHQIKKQQLETITVDELKPIQIDQLRGNTLGDIAKEITGVNVLKSGSTVSKPIIHGLHSNRIIILNNGVRQEGQQWGSEHAPEIDPFIATHLSVIKGAASIRYGTDALGGVVLLEPPLLPSEKTVDGELNLVGMSNGKLYCASGILEGAFDKKLSGLSWRIQGTYKRSGNLKAPHYNLDNTGVEEKNYSGALGYKKKWFSANLYYSKFDTQIGIYTGSHIGNPTELLATFNGEKKVEDYGFSYLIKRGYQLVNHDLFKAEAVAQLSSASKINFTFTRQKDVRQEYDFHLPYSSTGVDLSNYPQVYFQLITHTAEAVYEHPAFHHITGSIGVSFNTQGNVFKGLTYRSLIPNFRTYGGGLFVIEKRNWNKLTLEAGARYDYKWQREYILNNATLKTETPTDRYKNFSYSAGALYRFTENISVNLNSGSAWRAPSVYELYVYGIHGSLSTYEIGDSTLKSERAFNNILSIKYDDQKFTAEVGGYVNYIADYIFLQPQPGNYAVTYQGAFPLFLFKQTNALFKGIDLDLGYTISKKIEIQSHSNIVIADDLHLKSPLILIPAPVLRNNITWHLGDNSKLHDPYITVENYTALKQTRVPGTNSDFVPPPPTYSLWSVRAGCNFKINNQLITASVSCDNLFDTAYRDYLNLFRYYADEPGRNISLRIKIPFSIIKNNSNIK